VTDRSRLRLVVLSVLVVSLVATLLGRLWYLQVLAAPTFVREAAASQVRDIVTEAPRGDVFDDMGRPLIDNKTALVISVDRTALDRQPDEGKAVLHRLSKILSIPYGLLNHETQLCGKASDGHYVKAPCWGGSPYQPIPISQLKPDRESTEQALHIEEMHQQFPGVSAQLAAVRHYPRPDHANAAGILGYLEPISAAALKRLSVAQQNIQRGTDVGAEGIEASYEKYLHGKPGLKQVTVDHLGAVTGTKKNRPPKAGDDVITNIDAGVQAALETQLKAALVAAHLANYVGDYDAGVVMNVRTGGIIAMGSSPSYPVNHPPTTLTIKQYDRLQHEPGFPLIDKSYQAAAPPGSSFKLISASGLLWDGTAQTNRDYDCSASFNGKTNFEGEVGGEETLHTAIVQSCDTVFYRLAGKDWSRDHELTLEHKKPVEGVQHMAHDYGLGEPPEVDLPGAVSGHIGDRLNAKLAWEQLKVQYCKGAQNKSFSYQHRYDDRQYCKYGYIFQAGDQENEDIGQGTVTVSPLQLAVAYSALANGGTVFEPRVAKAIVSPTGKLIKRIKAPIRDHLPISAGDLTYIRDAMYGVTQQPGGTAAGVFANWPMSKVDVGGKTGTAELTGTSQNGSWFASFAGPAGGKPEYVAVIEVDKSKEGAISAAPFVKNIWKQIFGIGGDKALFPNGVAPTALPTISLSSAGSNSSHNGSGGSGSGAKHSTPPSPPPSSPSTGAAALPPTLRVEPRSRFVQ
jgi:penicillin-binding protein 2